MPAPRRFRIAAAVSVGFHAALLLAIGLLAGRTVVGSQVLIPIELTVEDRAAPTAVLGGPGQPEAPTKAVVTAAITSEQMKRPPASRGKQGKAAPAAPKVLTSKTGKDPAGEVGEGKEKAGAGGKAEAPAGPTYGPGVIGGPLPIYPKHALDQGLDGSVTLSVEVDENGSARSVAVTKGSGHAVLDQAAVRAVERGWQFKPGAKAGKPAGGEVSVTFEFSAGIVKRG